jgi:hypothetical protein
MKSIFNVCLVAFLAFVGSSHAASTNQSVAAGDATINNVQLHYWGREGDIIPTHSRIDAPQVIGDHFESPFQVGKLVELRGMAFGGDRGISKVEISSDDGDTWDGAEITKPGTKLTWSLWSFEWKPDEEGETAIFVRATDGNGKLQISEYRDQVPDGATGLHRVRATVEKA